MTILLVSDAKVVGGAEVYLASLAVWLRKAGLECRIVCPPGLRAHPRLSLLLGDRDLEAGDAFFGAQGHLTSLSLIRYLSSIRDLFAVHLNLTSPVPRYLVWMPLLCRLGGASFVMVTEHLPRVACRPELRLLKYFLNHFVDLTIAVCEAGKRHLTDFFWLKSSKVRVIHNGVVVPVRGGRLGARRKLAIDQSPVMILQVASLERRKGQVVLLSALAILLEKGLLSKVVAYFVGDGPDAGSLREEVKRLKLSACVRFVGHQENVEDYYAAADVFVLPSVKESFPLSILEAMSFGLPVIASNVDGIPEQIRHGESGFLFEAGDVESLTGFLEELVRRPELRCALGERGRYIVKERFSSERCFEETLRLLRAGVVQSEYGG